MDAREQLRRYLEQRREMGETELVLDTLAVDDALRMLGAMKGGAASTTMPSAAVNRAEPRQEAPRDVASPSESGSPSNIGETR